MKSLAELEALRKSTLEKINLRKEDGNGARIVVGMATCGIAAGARPVLNAFMEEIAKRKLENVMVTQTGCIGLCQYEPIVEIYTPGLEKVTYAKVTPEMVAQIVTEHVVNGKPCSQYTIGNVQK